MQIIFIWSFCPPLFKLSQEIEGEGNYSKIEKIIEKTCKMHCKIYWRFFPLFFTNFDFILHILNLFYKLQLVDHRSVQTAFFSLFDWYFVNLWYQNNWKDDQSILWYFLLRTFRSFHYIFLFFCFTFVFLLFLLFFCFFLCLF